MALALAAAQSETVAHNIKPKPNSIPQVQKNIAHVGMDGPLFKTVSHKIIKPSSPTPESLRCYKFSSLDQMSNNLYMPLVFFYPNHNWENPNVLTVVEIKKRLEGSLSKILTSYYPFAGRVVENDRIDCNDGGVEFLHVHFNCEMSEILNQKNGPPQKDLFLPKGLPWTISKSGDSLLIVQLSTFDCGGVALAVCMAHKIGDALTAFAFLKDWACTARELNYAISLKFTAASVFPPADFAVTMPITLSDNFVTRRYLFSGAEIEKFKAIAIESGLNKPSRVEVVSALLYKCAMAASKENSGSFKPSFLFQFTNLRPLTVPPMATNSMGNIVMGSLTLVTEEEKNVFPELVGEIRNARTELQNAFKSFTPDELILQIQELGNLYQSLADDRNCDLYICSSWCRFPLYEVDFGWGRPSWVCSPESRLKNSFVLMDTPSGDGVEVLVVLEESVMSKFELDKEIHYLASSNYDD